MRALIEPGTVAVLAQKELREAWRTRWFVLFTGAFCLVALGLAWLGVLGVSGSGFAGFGRTAASLLNLVLLIVPLMGLMLGAGAIAGERERGGLLYLLAQPLEPHEVVLGKFLGLSTAVTASVMLGFGLAGLVLASRGGSKQVTAFVAFLGLSAVIAMVAVSLGLLISTLASKASVAVGSCLFLWLILVLIGDLGLMGTAVALRFDAGALLLGALLNPLQVFKMAALLAIRGGLEILGPAGLYALREHGERLRFLLPLLLLLWVLLPLVASMLLLKRRGGLP